MQMTRSLSRVLSLGLSVMVLALSGCASTAETPQAPVSSPEVQVPKNSEPLPGTVTPKPKATGGEAVGTPGVPKDTNAESFEAIYQSMVAKGEKQTCTPGMRLEASNTKIALTGDCSDLTVSGKGLILAVEKAASLSVEGSDNVIAVRQLDDLSVTSSNNIIGWLSGSPTIKDQGTGNLIRNSAFAEIGIDF